REFGAARSQGLKRFPYEGRARALEQRRKMLDPEVTNAPLIVKSLSDPIPYSSLCSIGAWVDVQARERRKPFARSLLKIPFQESHLGWVDPTTLRVFEVNANKRSIRLIVESGADTERHWAWAYIDHA